jgi:hypothetical protein
VVFAAQIAAPWGYDMARHMLRSSALAFLVSLILCPSAAGDTILYSTLGTTFLSEGWKTHADVEQQISVAMPFTIGGSAPARLRTIELGFDFDPTGEDFLQIDVFTPTAGHPGTSMFAFSFDLPFVSRPDRLLTVLTDVSLAPGLYFLGLRTSGDIVGTWWETDAPLFGGWTSTNDGPWIQQSARPQGVFRLLGDQAAAVPEPASLIYLVSGLSGLWLRTRASRAHSRR